MSEKTFYFDNGATSFPKPQSVIDAWLDYSTRVGASPGRGNYGLSIEGGEMVAHTRKLMADLLGVCNPDLISFTRNATEALNIALFGLIADGDHVVTTITEHNAILRPLNKLVKNSNVEVDYAPIDSEGMIQPHEVFSLVKENTQVIIINGISNVTGLAAPIKDIGEFCMENGIIFIVDAAQLLGTLPVNVIENNIDVLGFTGHKNLYGPTGTGGLYHIADLEPVPLMFGGTGGMSDIQCMPDLLPFKYEAGTSNAAGIHALGTGIEFILEKGIERIRDHKIRLADRFVDGIRDIKGLYLIGPQKKQGFRLGVVSFYLENDSREVARHLWDKYRIAVRGGLHCTPKLHEFLGINDSLRFSFGIFNNSKEVDYAIKALKETLE